MITFVSGYFLGIATVILLLILGGISEYCGWIRSRVPRGAQKGPSQPNIPSKPEQREGPTGK